MLLKDYVFVADSDRSRAVALFLTPALIHAGLHSGRHGGFVVEAQEQGTGKGYLCDLVAATYKTLLQPLTVSDGKNGSAELKNRVSDFVLKGESNIILLDNLRSRLEFDWLESMMTTEHFSARVTYGKPQLVDVTGILWLATSNVPESSMDTASRFLNVRLATRPEGESYTFQIVDGLPLLEYVKRNSEYFLSAVLSLIRYWFNAGEKRLGDGAKQFNDFNKVCSGIVGELGLPPVTQDMAAIKERLTNPHLTFLREYAIAAQREGILGRSVQLSEMVEFVFEKGVASKVCDDVRRELSNGVPRLIGIEEDGKLKAAILAIVPTLGKQIGRSFPDLKPHHKEDVSHSITQDGFTITRAAKWNGDRGKHTVSYVFGRSVCLTT